MFIIDEFSRYPDVEIFKSTAAKHMLPKINNIFATHGFPELLKTDGGPPFKQKRQQQIFKTYIKWAGVKHKKVRPEDPEAKGMTENFMKNLKKSVAYMESRWKRRTWIKRCITSSESTEPRLTPSQDKHQQKSYMAHHTKQGY